MPTFKKLTLLHSNDMHGDFMAKEVDHQLLGGVSMLSGYVNKVRHEEENVLYAVAGDMFRGSLIDSEYKGLSTIQIMNLLAPDVVTLGNHEVDYGLAHLLFIEKCAKFPIINANLYLKVNYARMFRSHVVLHVGGMKILFIGILTETVLASTKREKIIGSLVDVEDAAQEVGKICNAYRTEDVDLTVLLTHIGIEDDKRLAAQLDPRWGVDVIVGGHSHTYLEKPVVVNGVPIVQAACGTGQIGRFDLTIDTDSNTIHDYTWQLVPINEDTCPRDTDLENVILHYKEQTDKKYQRIVCRLADRCTHPVRNNETQLGKLVADAFKDVLGLDLMLVGSGSIRRLAVEPIVRYQDLLELLPYNDAIHRLTLTGKQLRHMMTYMLRDEAFTGDTEFYQFSQGFRVEYDRAKRQLLSMSLNGREVEDTDQLEVGLQDYHLSNLKDCLDVTLEEVSAINKPRMISTNSLDVIEEYFTQQELVKLPTDRRLIFQGL